MITTVTYSGLRELMANNQRLPCPNTFNQQSFTGSRMPVQFKPIPVGQSMTFMPTGQTNVDVYPDDQCLTTQQVNAQGGMLGVPQMAGFTNSSNFQPCYYDYSYGGPSGSSDAIINSLKEALAIETKTSKGLVSQLERLSTKVDSLTAANMGQNINLTTNRGGFRGGRGRGYRGAFVPQTGDRGRRDFAGSSRQRAQSTDSISSFGSNYSTRSVTTKINYEAARQKCGILSTIGKIMIAGASYHIDISLVANDGSKYVQNRMIKGEEIITLYKQDAKGVVKSLPKSAFNTFLDNLENKKAAIEDAIVEANARTTFYETSLIKITADHASLIEKAYQYKEIGKQIASGVADNVETAKALLEKYDADIKDQVLNTIRDVKLGTVLKVYRLRSAADVDMPNLDNLRINQIRSNFSKDYNAYRNQKVQELQKTKPNATLKDVRVVFQNYCKLLDESLAKTFKSFNTGYEWPAGQSLKWLQERRQGGRTGVTGVTEDALQN